MSTYQQTQYDEIVTLIKRIQDYDTQKAIRTIFDHLVMRISDLEYKNELNEKIMIEKYTVEKKSKESKRDLRNFTIENFDKLKEFSKRSYSKLEYYGNDLEGNYKKWMNKDSIMVIFKTSHDEIFGTCVKEKKRMFFYEKKDVKGKKEIAEIDKSQLKCVLDGDKTMMSQNMFLQVINKLKVPLSGPGILEQNLFGRDSSIFESSNIKAVTEGDKYLVIEQIYVLDWSDETKF